MASLSLDKNAAALNRVLRDHGKKLGKSWRIRIRKLLAETFSALNAPKLDANRCDALGAQIDLELAWVQNPQSISEDALIAAFDKTMGSVESMAKPTFGNIPGNIEKEKPHIIDASDEDAPKPAKSEKSEQKIELSPLLSQRVQNQTPTTESDAVSSEPADTPKRAKSKKKSAPKPASPTPTDTAHDESIESSHSPDLEGGSLPLSGYLQANTPLPPPSSNTIQSPSVENQPAAKPTDPNEKPVAKAKGEEPPEIGYFDIVNVQVRQFFKINALVETYEIGGSVSFAEKYADSVDDRVEKFIAVLSKPEATIQFNDEVQVGYRDDLIKDMPDRNLVLHPKKKKKPNNR